RRRRSERVPSRPAGAVPHRRGRPSAAQRVRPTAGTERGACVRERHRRLVLLERDDDPRLRVMPPLEGAFDTVADALEAAATQFADREAYVEGDRRLSFGAWFRAADRLAAELVDRGVRPGDVVAITLPTSVDYA